MAGVLRVPTKDDEHPPALTALVNKLQEAETRFERHPKLVTSLTLSGFMARVFLNMAHTSGAYALLEVMIVENIRADTIDTLTGFMLDAKPTQTWYADLWVAALRGHLDTEQYRNGNEDGPSNAAADPMQIKSLLSCRDCLPPSVAATLETRMHALMAPQMPMTMFRELTGPEPWCCASADMYDELHTLGTIGGVPVMDCARDKDTASGGLADRVQVWEDSRQSAS